MSMYLRRYVWGILGVILLVVLPITATSSYYLQILTQLLIFSILFIGLDIAVGQAGLASVAHGALFGVGAYATGILTVKAGWGFWASVPIAIIIAGILGLLVGMLTLRLDGHYFVIATLAFGLLVTIVLQNWNTLTNGQLGLSPVPAAEHIFGIAFDNSYGAYYLVMVIAIIIALVSYTLMRTGIGQRLRAIRDNPPLASSIGINVSRTRLVAFIISAGIAGLAGSLQASNLTYIDPSMASFEVGFTALMAVIIGGRATVTGPFLGAAIFVVLPEILRTADEFRLIILGLLLLLTILFAPDGLAGRIQALYRLIFHQKPPRQVPPTKSTGSARDKQDRPTPTTETVQR